MTISELLTELREVEARFWFAQRLSEIEHTDDVLKARLEIRAGLFVHVFFSTRTERLQLALVQGHQRLYGRDREKGEWHLHPYAKPEDHAPMPEGMSPRPLLQFMAEVEKLLLDSGLI